MKVITDKNLSGWPYRVVVRRYGELADAGLKESKEFTDQFIFTRPDVVWLKKNSERLEEINDKLSKELRASELAITDLTKEKYGLTHELEAVRCDLQANGMKLDIMRRMIEAAIE